MNRLYLLLLIFLASYTVPAVPPLVPPPPPPNLVGLFHQKDNLCMPSPLPQAPYQAHHCWA